MNTKNAMSSLASVFSSPTNMTSSEISPSPPTKKQKIEEGESNENLKETTTKVARKLPVTVNAEKISKYYQPTVPYSAKKKTFINTYGCKQGNNLYSFRCRAGFLLLLAEFGMPVLPEKWSFPGTRRKAWATKLETGKCQHTKHDYLKIHTHTHLC